MLTRKAYSQSRRDSMKTIMIGLAALLCVGGFTARSFADEMGKMKDETKTEGMAHKDPMKGEMKGKSDDMKGQKDSMKSETTAKHDDMKGEMKPRHDEMKGEMKGTTGK